MSLSILQVKYSDLLILNNILMVGSRLLVRVTQILYIVGDILLLGKTVDIRL